MQDICKTMWEVRYIGDREMFEEILHAEDGLDDVADLSAMQLKTLPETPAQAKPAVETTEGKQEDVLACPLDLGYQSLRCHCTNPKTMNHNGSLFNSVLGT